MVYIAPNLSAIVGSAVAAKLMGTAGGLAALAKMPACNVQLLGAKKKNLAGFSTATSQFRIGYIEQTEMFQSTPPPLRMRACRLLAAKSTLAARVDSTRGRREGHYVKRSERRSRNGRSHHLPRSQNLFLYLIQNLKRKEVGEG